MTDLGIIIVSWNVRELLAACLGSVIGDQLSVIGNQLSVIGDQLSGTGNRSSGIRGEETACKEGEERLRVEVVVVDNGSTDGSAEMVRCQFPQVRLIASERNLGFAGGNNLGLKTWGLEQGAAGTTLAPRYVLLLNPDTLVHGDALARLVRFMDATPRAGICGARLIYGDGSFQHSAFGFPGLWQIALDRPRVHPRLLDSRLNGRYSRQRYAAGRPFEVDHPLGAAMLVRVEAIRQVGLMDEGFHMYCEEVDWSWRIKKAGWQVFCVPQAEIVHYGGQSTRQVKPEMVVALWTSRRRLYRKHYSAWKWKAAYWLVRYKMRDELRRVEAEWRRGSIDEATYRDLAKAYRKIIELYKETK